MKKEICTEILRIMVERGKTVSTAESCTSGRIAASLTQISGASDYFQGGIVCYQDALKERFLNVSPDDIRKDDVVSRQVVEQMVRGACRLFDTDYAMASTGYAGGGMHGIPDGTIWIGWGSADDVHSMVLTDDRGREANTENAVVCVLSEFLNISNVNQTDTKYNTHKFCELSSCAWAI